MSTRHSSDDNGRVDSDDKHILLIRHGCSYMNEYIGTNGISFGGPNFTDIFDQEERERYYRDSPLSPQGQDQAEQLRQIIGNILCPDNPELHEDHDCKEHLEQLELVVVSPLTRALQTAELALLPHIADKHKNIPIVALPLAAERLYLVSDIGRPRSELAKSKFGSWVDFETQFSTQDDEPWWFQQHASDETYQEWRPTGQGQQYYCPGEPDEAFHERMVELCHWLNIRKESKMALVGHFGVFEWLLQSKNKKEQMKFGNCEMRVVSFQQIWDNLNQIAVTRT